jgi:hypothetical protein
VREEESEDKCGEVDHCEKSRAVEVAGLNLTRTPRKATGTPYKSKVLAWPNFAPERDRIG